MKRSSYQNELYVNQQLERYKQRLSQMIIQIILAFFLILASYLSFTCYFQPKKTQAWYKKTLEDLGYTVHQIPYQCFRAPLYQDYQKNVQIYGDAQYFQKTSLKNYDVQVYNAFNITCLKFVKPELIAEVLSPEKNKIYVKNELFLKSTKIVVGKGLIFSEGQQWRRKRVLLSRLFNFELIKENIKKICQICDKSLDENEKHHKSLIQDSLKKQTFEFETLPIAAKIFNRIVMKCFLGCNQLANQIDGKDSQIFMLDLVNDTFACSFHPLLLVFGIWPYKLGFTKFLRNLKRRNDIFQKLIQSKIIERIEEIKFKRNHVKQTQQKPTDIIEALIYDKINSQKSQQFNVKEISDEFISFLLAGTDTTAHFFMMTIYYLSMNPRVQERLRKEINSLIKTDQDYTNENLKQIYYIDWIQNEVTRMYGPGTGLFLRNSIEDHFIKDIPMKKGVNVSIQQLGNHYNEKYFINPEEFRPERWEKQCDYLEPHVFIGFSGGPRACIGKQLALLESKIALIKIIKRYTQIDIPEEQKKDMKMTMKLVYEPFPFLTKYVKQMI